MPRTYRVGDGDRTYGEFSSEAAAKRMIRDLKTEGTRARVYVLYDEPKGKAKTGQSKKASRTAARKSRAPATKAEQKPPMKTKVEPPKTIDIATCSIHDLAGILYMVQEAHLRNRRWYDAEDTRNPNPVFTREEIEGILSNPVLAPSLCDTYLNCYVSRYSEYWGGWDEYTMSYEEWQALEARLRSIRADAVRQAEVQMPADPLKPKKKPRRRYNAASEGRYSASYYEKLERELRRAEKEGDEQAIMDICREIGEAVAAEGEEIPDARAYLDDSDYGELARNSRWKYDSRETNRRFLRKRWEEQSMYGTSWNRKRWGWKAARRGPARGSSKRVRCYRWSTGPSFPSISTSRPSLRMFPSIIHRS